MKYEAAFDVWYKQYAKKWRESEDEPPDSLVARNAWSAAIAHMERKL
jgi:hypothetical protein